MNSNKKQLEFAYIQIVSLYINKRKDIYNLIFTNHKNKDAILSLKFNIIPMRHGDELRFPNIETQLIYPYDEYYVLVYPTRKIKYKSFNRYFRKMEIENNVKNYELKTYSNKYIKLTNYSICPTINIYSNNLNNLIYLKIYKSLLIQDTQQTLNINLPSLKSLTIGIFKNADFILNTPQLLYLDVDTCNSIKIINHNLVYIHCYTILDNEIDCKFNYPFYYNGYKCKDYNGFKKVMKNRYDYRNSGDSEDISTFNRIYRYLIRV